MVVVAGYAAYRSLAQRPVDPLVPSGNAYHIACAEASLRWAQSRNSTLMARRYRTSRGVADPCLGWPDLFDLVFGQGGALE